MEPFVSILITTYNLENVIRETMESVLSQRTDYPFEVLVGDDGSSDGTCRILEEYQKEYPEKIRLFTMPRDPEKQYDRIRRSAANRMNLLSHARGKYISFLDGDDYYLSTDRLQTLSDILERPENADCSMAAHNLNMVWEDGREEVLCRAKRERKITFSQYWPLMFLQANALMFRNYTGTDMPKGPLKELFDDNMITFWIFRHGKMYYVPECLGAYRQSEGSSWDTMDPVKRAASNTLGFGLEQLLLMGDKRGQRISAIRHYPDVKALTDMEDGLTRSMLSPYYETAEELKIPVALRIYRYGHKGGVRRSSMKAFLTRSAIEYYRAKAQRAIRKLLGWY